MQTSLDLDMPDVTFALTMTGTGVETADPPVALGTTNLTDVPR